jgi:hypothetical protein
MEAWRNQYEMINFGSYVRLTLSPFFFDQLTDNEKTYRHFMQDSDMVHTLKYSVSRNTFWHCELCLEAEGHLFETTP